MKVVIIGGVAGGGFIGVETAENLVRRGLEVTLAEFAPQVMPPLDPEMAQLVPIIMRALLRNLASRKNHRA